MSGRELLTRLRRWLEQAGDLADGKGGRVAAEGGKELQTYPDPLLR